MVESDMDFVPIFRNFQTNGMQATHDIVVIFKKIVCLIYFVNRLTSLQEELPLSLSGNLTSTYVLKLSHVN